MTVAVTGRYVPGYSPALREICRSTLCTNAVLRLVRKCGAVGCLADEHAVRQADRCWDSWDHVPISKRPLSAARGPLERSCRWPATSWRTAHGSRSAPIAACSCRSFHLRRRLASLCAAPTKPSKCTVAITMVTLLRGCASVWVQRRRRLHRDYCVA